MTRVPLFSEAEIAAAQTQFNRPMHHPIGRVYWFRNALQTFLRDVENRKWETFPKVLFAVDTTEVTAAIRYDQSAFDLFAFRALLSRSPDSNPVSAELNAAIERLDRLTLVHLLEGRRLKFILLDPHADEIANLRLAYTSPKRRQLFSVEPSRFEGYSVEHLDRLEHWLRHQDTSSAQQTEWQDFLGKFLPRWRNDMVEQLYDQASSLAAYSSFVNLGKYLFVRPRRFGDRSLELYLNDSLGIPFDWKAYEEFANIPDSLAEFDEVATVVTTLLTATRGTGQRVAQVNANDGQSIAINHMLNRFLIKSKLDVRIELLSRSEKIHKVMAALPVGRLRLAVRHPLLTPQIYDLEPKLLQSLGEVFQQVEAVVAPYLVKRSQADNANEAAESLIWDQDPALSRSAERKALEELPKAASTTAQLLSNVLPIQQSLDLGNAFVANLYTRSLSDARNPAANIPGRIAAIFDLLRQQLLLRDDPFTAKTFVELVRRNLGLIDFERARTFSDADTPLAVRVMVFEHANDIMPEPCVVIRPIRSHFGRMFHIHSARVGDLIKSGIGLDGPSDSDRRSSSSEPVTAKLLPNDILKQATMAFKAIEQSAAVPLGSRKTAKSQSDLVFSLDATLLVAILFASRHRFDTAVSLISSVLHPFMEVIRNDPDRISTTKDDLCVILASRELLLLRHYCERAIAMDDQASPGRFVDGLAGRNKNFARAQRDLELAALMSEHAERCMSHGAGSWDEVGPAGARLLMDHRLRQAHTAGWIDQFMIVAESIYKDAPRNDNWEERQRELHRRRLDIWTAAGLVRELVTDAYFAQQKRAELAAQSSEIVLNRYLAHVEARAYQGALTMFLVFLAYRIAPDMQGFWEFGNLPRSDQALVFRDWPLWWAHYSKLHKEFDFDMQMPGLIDPVCEAVHDLKTLTPETANRLGIISKLVAQLRSISVGMSRKTFMSQLCEAIIRRVGDAR